MRIKAIQLGAIVIVTGFVALTVSARPAATAPAVAAGGSANVMGVRVQWLDLAGNHPHTDCTVHLVNKSLTEAITVDQFVVLGPDGRNDVIGISPNAIGTTMQPLAEMRIPITSAFITGAFPQTAFGQPGARNAIVKWSGPSDALHLEGLHQRYATGQTDQRTHWVTRGYRAID